MLSEFPLLNHFYSTLKYKSPIFVDLASELDDEGEAISRIDELIREESRGPKIRIGITGECGAGKSAFINAIRG